MAYEKADFYAAYGKYPHIPGTNKRLAQYREPGLFGGQKITIRLHYHPAVIKPESVIKAQRVIDYLITQGTPLTAADRLVIVGGAFGWLGEALEDLIPGLQAVSVDLSQYVQDTKDLSPDDELIESIVAEGYDHTVPSSVGEFLFNSFHDPNPRSRDGSKVLQEDLSSVKSRNAVRKALQSTDPTRIITEEVWQILTQAEQDKYTAAAASWGVPLTHIIDGVII